METEAKTKYLYSKHKTTFFGGLVAEHCKRNSSIVNFNAILRQTMANEHTLMLDFRSPLNNKWQRLQTKTFNQNFGNKAYCLLAVWYS